MQEQVTASSRTYDVELLTKILGEASLKRCESAHRISRAFDLVHQIDSQFETMSDLDLEKNVKQLVVLLREERSVSQMSHFNAVRDEKAARDLYALLEGIQHQVQALNAAIEKQPKPLFSSLFGWFPR